MRHIFSPNDTKEVATNVPEIPSNSHKTQEKDTEFTSELDSQSSPISNNASQASQAPQTEEEESGAYDPKSIYGEDG